MINDWLAQEFRDRVSQKRKLLLTDRLSVALKKAGIGVSRKEEEAEAQFLKHRPSGLLALGEQIAEVGRAGKGIQTLADLMGAHDAARLQIGKQLADALSAYESVPKNFAEAFAAYQQVAGDLGDKPKS